MMKGEQMNRTSACFIKIVLLLWFGLILFTEGTTEKALQLLQCVLLTDIWIAIEKKGRNNE